MKRYRMLILFLAGILISGCSPKVTKQKLFADWYNEKPASILVLPPINETTAAEAKEYYLTTIAEPLTLTGYYVYPIEVVSDILQREGLYDTELARNVPPAKFKEYFGADAVLFVRLLKWNTSYYVIGGNVTVKLEAELKSTATGKQLWYYDNEVVVNTEGTTGGAGGLTGLLVKAVTTAITTAAQDYVPVARKANQEIMESMPFGKEHPVYLKDGNYKVKEKRGDTMERRRNN